MLVYPVGLPVSTTAHQVLMTALAEHRTRLRTPWRALSPARQALLVLAHLHDNQTYAALAAGFGIGTATVYRYVVEACQVLARMAPTLDQALEQAWSKAYLVLDGTVTGDRSRADQTQRRRPGPLLRQDQTARHERALVIASGRGDLVWCSPSGPRASATTCAPPGSTTSPTPWRP